MSYRFRLPPSLRTAVESVRPLRPLVEPVPSLTSPVPTQAGGLPVGAPASQDRSVPLAPLPAYRIISTAVEAVETCASFSSASALGVDIETYALSGAGDKGALDHTTNRIRLVQVSGQDGRVAIFDLDSLHGLPAPLRAVLMDETVQKIFFNARFDAGGLFRHFDIEIANIVDLLAGAILVTGYATHQVRGAHTLQAEVRRHLDMTLPKELGASDWSKQALTSAQLDYAARDAAVLLPLHQRISSAAARVGVQRAWDLENGIISATVALDATGMMVHRPRLETLAREAREGAATSAQRARVELGAPALKLGAHAEIKRRVKEIYGLDLKNTTAEVLLANAERAPALAHIVASRRAKGRADAAEGYLAAIEPDGRVRGRFNPLAASTGRYACAKPNLQNVPRDSSFRSVFVPAPGHKLIVADYAASQLRIAAYLTEDVELSRCFTSIPPVDPHRRTASLVLGKAMELITRDERHLAKAVNFGLTFGMGAWGFVDYARDEYGVIVTIDQARRFRARFLALYHGIRSWHARVARECWSMSGARTLSGRLRLLPKINGRPQYREYLNTPVQGTEADGLKAALALLHPRLKLLGARLVNVIHDEVVVETSIIRAEEVLVVVVDAMVAGMQQFIPSIPVVVEAVIADSWVKP